MFLHNVSSNTYDNNHHNGHSSDNNYVSHSFENNHPSSSSQGFSSTTNIRTISDLATKSNCTIIDCNGIPVTYAHGHGCKLYCADTTKFLNVLTSALSCFPPDTQTVPAQKINCSDSNFTTKAGANVGILVHNLTNSPNTIIQTNDVGVYLCGTGSEADMYKRYCRPISNQN